MRLQLKLHEIRCESFGHYNIIFGDSHILPIPLILGISHDVRTVGYMLFQILDKQLANSVPGSHVQHRFSGIESRSGRFYVSESCVSRIFGGKSNFPCNQQSQYRVRKSVSDLNIILSELNF
jgi:hypothetical protein